MNAVGIDVPKGKSTVAILRPMGEVVQAPIDVSHDAAWNGWRIRFLLWGKIPELSWKQPDDTIHSTRTLT